MLPFGMILGFAGYGIGTWGYILVKGYNITLKQWFSPLAPYTGSFSTAGTVPKGQLFPGGKGSTGTTPQTLSPQQQAGANALRTKDRPPVQ